LSEQLAHVSDRSSLCAASVRSISATFEALSVSFWVGDEGDRPLTLAVSTARNREDDSDPVVAPPSIAGELMKKRAPFDLDAVSHDWAAEFRQLNPMTFPNGGHRWCVPLTAGQQMLGAIVLGDRVNGRVYSAEEVELLKCLGDQITSVMLNLRLAGEVARAREFEAFRTISAFFVHDLKNAAASLNLMLKNLPVHFDDPAFRADALRGVGNAARRIDEMIARFSALRQAPAFQPSEMDLNRAVEDALAGIGQLPAVEVTRALRPIPAILADREQVQSVVTNLVLNARDAVADGGEIQVRTALEDGRVVVSVADNGCGMSHTFIRDSLFRPFQSTKAKGLGIGLFQSRRIVEAHGGQVLVESEPGRGTTFRVTFPLKAAR
jgi:putative PEP-CTERM system histidine kinase